MKDEKDRNKDKDNKLSIGMGLGITFGILIDNLVVGISIGLA
ncbi:hypothetical protein NSA23_04535 [Anaerosalibacter massiliensis]|uniref:Uncharacterized protein n=1 Tax=Anaerosalibacter massiliensis TaxID=1347392 RepID=A0A9X2S698_9FIRM|nr:hypothetical protein [Anaerosalibacter massiliensis]MCR2043382.1 hypothetical protein [Anaerosalibacter massiliensis]